ncbi:MAG: glycine zipper 2TM domain-containing protein [Candidatus Omnitrophota bacterium]
MKNRPLFCLVLVLAVALVGCESMGPKAKTGAVVGGVVGAAAGAVIGHQMHSGVAGGLIGAAVGAVGGGLLGNEWDKADEAAKAENPAHLTTAAIIDMAAKGMTDDAIISEIKRTNSTYHLTSETITYLKQNKVSDKVIDYMLGTASSAS